MDLETKPLPVFKHSNTTIKNFTDGDFNFGRDKEYGAGSPQSQRSRVGVVHSLSSNNNSSKICCIWSSSGDTNSILLS